MNDDIILETLQGGVIAAVAASIAPDFPVKYINRTFDIASDAPDGRWLELVFIPNNREDFWGSEMNYRGMFRLILHWQTDDAGAYTPLGILKSVAGYFSKGLLLQNVQIYERPSLGGALEEGAETLFPCSLRYQSFQA